MAKNEESDSLESADNLELETQVSPAKAVVPRLKVSFGDRIRAKAAVVNIYFLIFILILVIALIITFLLWRSSRDTSLTGSEITRDVLTQEALDDLRNKDTSVGDSKQILTIASTAVFNGRVLVRDSLDVAGTITVGGTLSLPGITVSGNSKFDEVEIASNLTVGGDTALQGTLSVQRDLNVTGGASFGGPISAPTLNVQNLNLSGDLALNSHIDAGGGIPSSTRGSSIGSGGTTSSNGSDTAGTVTINTGSSPSAGSLVNVQFAVNFSQTPHIVITPVGQTAAGLDYYITRTTSGFTIGTASAPPANTTLVFDFIAID